MVKLKRPPPCSPFWGAGSGDPYHLKYEQIILVLGSECEKKGGVSQDFYVETMVTCISTPTYIAKKCPITANPISVQVKTNYDFED